MISKEKIRDAFVDYLKQKVNDLESELVAIKESATSETKSSMGDKYETSREMMMQERNRLGSQLNVFSDQLAALNTLDVDKKFDEVSYGCIVQTSEAIFFISAAVGSLKIGELNYFAISGEAPLVKAMVGKKVGETFSFNKKNFSIKFIE